MVDVTGDLAAIIAAPQDDAPRLRLADELTARGDPRGEFIRLQIERARQAAGSDEEAGLARRERELLAEHEAEWVEPIAEGLLAWSFRRGFVEEVTLDAETLLANGAAQFAGAPLQSLTIHNAGGVAGDLAQCPLLARVTRLRLGSDEGDNEPLGSEGLAALANSPHLAVLRALGFGMEQIEGDALPALAGASWIGQLRSLDLSHNELGNSALAKFLASAPLSRLEELNLDWTGAGAETVQALARKDWGALRRLNLANNQIRGAGLAHLATAALPALTALDLTCTYLEPGDLTHLSASAFLPQLSELRIGGNNKLVIGDLSAFIAAPGFPALKSLAAGGKFGDAGAKLVAGASILSGLKALDFSCSWLTAAGIESLAASPHLAGLEELQLFSNKGKTAAAVAVASSPAFARLRSLNLSNNEAGDAGAEALAQSPHLLRLRTLSLRASGLTDVAARAIAGSGALANLEWIDLAFNKISGDGARALASSAGLGNLHYLDISRNALDRDGANLLRQRFGRGVKAG